MVFRESETPGYQQKALAGLKVLAYCQLISGPYCTKMLADLGAEVIKIEEPGVGDDARRMWPFPNDIPQPEKSGFFLCLNTNKLGITLNPKTTTGKKIFKKLVEQADVLVEDKSPGDMEELGLDYESLVRLNPQLIMTSITPFGQTGPYRHYRAYDINLQSAGGFAYANGLPEREPLIAPVSLADFHTALNGVVGTLTALLCRPVIGRGQHVDVSGQEGVASILGDVIVTASWLGRAKERTSAVWEETLPNRPPWPGGIHACKDGYVYISLVEPRHWKGMAELLGNPPWSRDPRLEQRYLKSEDIRDLNVEPQFKEAIKSYTREELFDGAQKYHVPVTPIWDIKEVMESPQLKARGFFTEIDHPKAGRLSYPGAPYKLSRTPWLLERPAPLLGQHNEEVYCQRLGYSKKDLVKLRETGII